MLEPSLKRSLAAVHFGRNGAVLELPHERLHFYSREIATSQPGALAKNALDAVRAYARDAGLRKGDLACEIVPARVDGKGRPVLTGGAAVAGLRSIGSVPVYRFHLTVSELTPLGRLLKATAGYRAFHETLEKGWGLRLADSQEVAAEKGRRVQLFYEGKAGNPAEFAKFNRRIYEFVGWFNSSRGRKKPLVSFKMAPPSREGGVRVLIDARFGAGK